MTESTTIRAVGDKNIHTLGSIQGDGGGRASIYNCSGWAMLNAACGFAGYVH
jgi:hypothetical protein